MASGPGGERMTRPGLFGQGNLPACLVELVESLRPLELSLSIGGFF